MALEYGLECKNYWLKGAIISAQQKFWLKLEIPFSR
jgi:hypothetical protein